MDRNIPNQAEAGVALRDEMPTGLPLQALPMFFFIHVPKTGGTSLNTVLHEMFFPFSIYHGQISEQAGGNGNIAHFLSTRPSFYDHLLLVVGHFAWRHPLVHAVKRRRIILSVMRNPIDRIVSLYDYMRLQDDHPQNSTLRNMSLREAINESSRFRSHCENAQLQTIFGTRDEKEAQKRLRQEHYVLGQFDHLPRFIQAVENVSGLKRRSDLQQLNSKPATLPILRAREQPDFQAAIADLHRMNAAEMEFFAKMPPILATVAA